MIYKSCFFLKNFAQVRMTQFSIFLLLMESEYENFWNMDDIFKVSRCKNSFFLPILPTTEQISAGQKVGRILFNLKSLIMLFSNTNPAQISFAVVKPTFTFYNCWKYQEVYNCLIFGYNVELSRSHTNFLSRTFNFENAHTFSTYTWCTWNFLKHTWIFQKTRKIFLTHI